VRVDERDEVLTGVTFGVERKSRSKTTSAIVSQGIFDTHKNCLEGARHKERLSYSTVHHSLL
jgi:hypothetical protein